jgi:hypothetical protein
MKGSREVLGECDEMPNPTWVPVTLKKFPNSCPKKFSKMATKENVVAVLNLTAHRTSTIGRAVALGYLLASWEPPPDQLPEKDLHLGRDPGAPHVLEKDNLRPMRESKIHGSSRKAP